MMDGSLFSYGMGPTSCGGVNKAARIDTDGYPLIPDAIETLKHQLTITGSLISNNTYGGSSGTNPVSGRGEAFTRANASRAQLFDLNFLRYAKTRPRLFRGAPIPNTLCWGNDVWLSKSITTITPPNTGDGTAHDTACIRGNSPDPNGRGVVNIIYRQPSSTMLIFNSVK